MEQKAKRIGKFNIIDIIAVILILAVLAFVGWKLMNRGGGIDGQCRLWQQEQSHQAKVCFFHPCHSLYIQILRTVYHARRPAVHAPAAIF